MNKIIKQALAGVAALGIAASGLALGVGSAYAVNDAGATADDKSLQQYESTGTITIKNASNDNATHYLNGYRLASFYSVTPKDENGNKTFQYQLDTNDAYVAAIEAAMGKVKDASASTDGNTKTLLDTYKTSAYYKSVTSADNVADESNPMGWIAENIGDPKDQLTNWSNQDSSELRQFADALKAVLEDTTKNYSPTYAGQESQTGTVGKALQSAPATDTAPNGQENTVGEGYYLLLDQFDEASDNAAETAPAKDQHTKSTRSIPILVASTIPAAATTNNTAVTAEYGVGTVTLKATTPQVAKQLTDENGNAKNDPTFNIGDDVYYELTATIPDFTAYDHCTAYPTADKTTDGSGQCRKFIITDTASKGLTVDANSVVSVKVDGKDAALVEDKTGATNPDYKVQQTKVNYDGTAVEEGRTGDSTQTTIDLGKFVNDKAGDLATYYGKTVTVKFKAVLNKDANISTPGSIAGNPNKVGLEYSNKADNVSDAKKVPGGEVNVYTFKFDFVKTGMDGTTPVAGAKFYLLDGTKTNYYKKADDGKWTTTSDKSEATTFTSTLTSDKKKAEVKGFDGLKKGDYYVQEYEAAPGYTSFGLPTFKVTLSDNITHDNSTQPSSKKDIEWGDDTVTTVIVTAETGSYVIQNGNVITVKNAKNITELPKTGGAGLALIVVVGGLFIAAAGIFGLRSRRNA